MNQTSLNISVIVGSVTPQQWVVRTLERLQNNAKINIECLILQSTPAAPLTQNNQATALGLVSKLITHFTDRPLFPIGPLTSEALPNELKHLLADSSNRVNSALDKGSSEETDVVLHLGSCTDPLPANTPHAKHGIWFINTDELNHCVQFSALTHPTLHWLHLWKWTDKTALQVERVASHSLPMQSYSKTDISTYTFGALPDFIVSRLNWLANGVDPKQYEATQIKSELFNEDAYPSQPVSKQLSPALCCLRSLGSLFEQSTARLRSRIQDEQWQLAFTDNNDHVVEKTIRDFKTLTPHAGMTWADPHMLLDNGKTHVFFEALDDSEDNGTIGHAVLTNDGFENTPTTVLEEPHHLSYPFVFKHEHEFYMIPETASRNCITLYKAEDFPNGWKKVGNMMNNINAADTTLLRHNGLWWMFTNGMSHPAVDERDQLMLFYSEDLLSQDWTPHPLNPVVTGVDRSRMAGAIYTKDGELFRPSQYGAKRYGFGINLSRISRLSTTEYEETLVNRLTPSSTSDWIGCHTAANTNQYIVIDRLQRISKRRTRGSGANYQGHGLHQSLPDQ